jgi:hypothetical protein
MCEPKVNEKKMVSRNVGIALGIISIVLAAGLVGAIANYTSIVNWKDGTISSLNSQVSDLNNVLYLGNSTVWVDHQMVSQSSSNYTSWNFHALYAGIIVVHYTSSTLNTYVQVIYYYQMPLHPDYSINYNQQIGEGYGGVATFPIVPSNIEIRVGNTNTVDNATETVTVTYYY